MEMNQKKVFWTSSSWVVLLLILSVLLSLVSNQLFINYINSDSLYDIETALNFWHNKSFAFQNFPIAPCFFPDLSIYILLSLFTHNITLLHLGYLLVFLTAELIIVYGLMRTTQLSKTDSLFALGWSFAAFFLIIPNGISLTEWKGSHFSSLLFSLWFLQYYLKNHDKPSNKLQFCGLFLLSFIFYISDNIVVMYLMAPLSVVILLDLYWQKTTKKMAISFFGLFLFTILAGVKIPALIETFTSASFSNNSSLFRIPAHELLGQRFLEFLTLLIAHIQMFPVFYFLIFAYNLLVLVGIFFIRKNSNLLRIFWFLYVAQILNIIMTIAAGKIEVFAQFRYLTPIFFYPAVALGLVGAHCYAQKKWVPSVSIMGAILGCMWVAVFLYYYHQTLVQISLQAPYNNDVACLDRLADQYQIKNGVAEYWSVRPNRMLSKRGLHLTQVNGDLKFFNLIDNQIHTYQDLKHKIPFQYQFIIANNLPKEKIQNAIGKPDVIVLCPVSEVWLFAKSESSARLNNYFRQFG